MYLERFVYGWDEIECPLLACLAMGYPVILVARHGTAKSLVMRVLSQAMGFRCGIYIAPVEDLTSLAGLPNPKEMAEGRFALVPHGRSLQGVEAMGIDELPRAPAGVQNMLLEVVLERTILGQPLDVKTIVATMNPETYAASNSLDVALADRFVVTLPVPDCQDLDAEERYLMLDLACHNGVSPEAVAGQRLADLPIFLEAIRAKYEELQGSVLDTVTAYAAQFLSVVHGKLPGTYISPRREVIFVRCLLACTAYYCAAGIETSAALNAGAEAAIVYCLAVPLTVDPEVLLGYHGSLRAMLKAEGLDSRDQYLLDLSLMEGGELLEYLEKTAGTADQMLSEAEKEKILGQLLSEKSLAPTRLWRLILRLLPGSEPLRSRALVRLTEGYRWSYEKVRRELGGALVVDDQAEADAQEIAGLVERYGRQPVTVPMLEALQSAATGLDGKVSPLTIATMLRKAIGDAAEPAITAG
jgi:MoxR-like ATPase